MKITKIKSEINRIAKIESPKKCQEEVRNLARKIKEKMIKKVKMGNYCYFYQILEYFYDKETRHGREKSWKKLGRILKTNYEKNKKKIDQLVLEKNKDELKKYLEEY